MLRRLTFAIPSGFLIISIVCIIALTRCGFPVCIAGVGLHGQSDCGETITPVSSTGTGQFTMLVSYPAGTTSISVGSTVQVTANGGVNGPYTYEVDPNSNPAPASTFAGGFLNPSSGLYTAPTTLTGSGVTTETVTVRATDSTGAFQTTTITVTAG